MMYNHDNWDFICYFGGHFVLQFWKGKTENRAWHGADLKSAYPNCVKTTAWQILLRNALQTLRMPLFEKWALTKTASTRLLTDAGQSPPVVSPVTEKPRPRGQVGLALHLQLLISRQDAENSFQGQRHPLKQLISLRRITIWGRKNDHSQKYPPNSLQRLLRFF